MCPQAAVQAVEAVEAVEASFVRSYVLTGGRTRPEHSLGLDIQLEAGPGRAGPALPHECHQILALCRSRRRSVAELAGTLHRPVGVVRVLVSDLLDARALRVCAIVPGPASSDDSPAGPRPSRQNLEAVLVGLKHWQPRARPQAV
ncbi:protein of unknown function DUF742 [Actinobacteria bacterium OK074]|nr:protein of unknown function DUF742 [Actinobacteria bacterium OK074]